MSLKVEDTTVRDSRAVDISNLPKYIDMCRSSEYAEILEGVTSIRKLLSIEVARPIQEVVGAGVVGLLVSFMRDYDREQLQYQASWALTNIASGDGDCTFPVIEAGAIEVWIEHLKESKSPQVVGQAVWGLGNVMGEGADQRDMCVHLGVVPSLLAVISGPVSGQDIVSYGLWALSNVIRLSPSLPWDSVVGIPDVAFKYAMSTDREVSSDAIWMLKYLSDMADAPPHFIQSSALIKLVESSAQIIARQPNIRVPLQSIQDRVSSMLPPNTRAVDVDIKHDSSLRGALETQNKPTSRKAQVKGPKKKAPAKKLVGTKDACVRRE